MPKTDLEIQKDVVTELETEPSIDAAGIGVIVREGVVMLTGSVPTYAQKSAAEGAVRRVAGVKGIAEALRVEPKAEHRRDDADIARDARSAMERDVIVPPNRIEVRVERGHVTLTGEVAWNFQREAAKEAVARVPGVIEVSDLVNVATGPPADPIEVQRCIRRSFHRWAQDESNRIEAEVSDGKVTLHGTTSSWLERASASRAAWAAPGVRQVENLVTVEP